MEIIRNEEKELGQNIEICKTEEYSFKDKDIDLGVATIKGRYPDEGYCMNEISKELIYVLEGEGTLFLEDKEIAFKKGDAILINNNEKYYWTSSNCTISMTCTPAWNKNQYKIIK